MDGETYLRTIGVHMSRKRLERNGHLLDFFIWDLAGGENFKVIRSGDSHFSQRRQQNQGCF
jgi:hypothetical protein